MSVTDIRWDGVPVSRGPVEPVTPPPVEVEWCVACGFQHDSDTHCAECTGVHQGGYCLTPEAIAELGRHKQLAASVEAAAPRVIDAGDVLGGRS